MAERFPAMTGEAAVEAHLRGCAACREFADDLRRMGSEVTRVVMPSLSFDGEAFLASVNRRIDRRSRKERRLLVLRPYLAAAAAILLTVVSLGGGFRLGEQAGRDAERQAAKETTVARLDIDTTGLGGITIISTAVDPFTLTSFDVEELLLELNDEELESLAKSLDMGNLL
jgi:predicted anti-sigma-YlaC factor YlaD